MTLLLKKISIGVLVLLSVSQIQGAKRIAKRQAMNGRRNDLDLSNLANDLGRLWVVGPLARDAVNYMGEAIIDTDETTNGLLSRTVGGQLPCVVDFNGFHCSGVSAQSGAFGVFESVIDDTPMPQIGKTLIIDSVRIFVNPLVDTLLGGIRKAGTT